MRLFRFLCSLLTIIFVVSISGMAQTAVSSLHGSVTDPSGAVISSGKVKISRTDVGFSKDTETGKQGEYSFVQLAPGRYTITATADGFSDISKIVDLLINQPATVNFEMRVAVESTVVVESTASAINTVDATIGTAFNTQQVQLLPFEGSNIGDLLSLQAGVVFTGDTNETSNTDTRPGSVNGARSDQNNITLDGLDNNLVSKGFAFNGALRATRDSLGEFRVVTTNSNADSGRSSGAQVALLTRSGTNDIHGSAYYYYRPTNTVANDWFIKKSQLGSGRANIPPKFLRNLYGGSFGAPVIHDKLFFFGAYEALSKRESSAVTNTVPTESFKAGTLKYNSANGTTTLSREDLASIDPKCSGNGTCPLGAGANPAALAYFAQYPVANSTAKGDGLNTAAYAFASPNPLDNSTFTVRLDYHPVASQSIFVRANLQDDNVSSPIQFPGAPPTTRTFDNTKGIAAGDVWTIGPSLINNVRYGFTRPGTAIRGNIGSPYVTFDSIAPLAANSLTSISITGLHNVVDDVSWNKGRHSLQFGGNYRLVLDQHSTNSTIFNNAGVSTGNLVAGGIAGTGSSLDPGAFGFPDVSNGFYSSYNTAIADITGLITEATGYANYSVSNGALTALPEGVTPTRHFRSNEFEYYAQDTWKVKPSLSLTFGVRHTLLQSPYERDGQQVVPNLSLTKWFNDRNAAAAAGGVNQPPISFTQGGQAVGKQAYWEMDKFDIAPRFAFAWSPRSDLSVRGGYGLYYDHFGNSLVYALDQRGSFGLSSTLSNGASQYVDTAPRFSSVTAVPTSLLPVASNPGSFPVTPPDELLTAWVLVDKVKTPYAHVMDLSVQQELPKGMVFEVDYLGRLGRRLMQQLDLAEPLNVVDSKSGIDYYTAATEFAKYIDEGRKAQDVPDSPFWENQFPLAAAAGLSATKNIYQNRFVNNRGNETEGIFELDLGLAPGAPNGETYRYFNPQYVNLVGFTSIGTSSYHSLQASLHRPMSHGFQFDVNYSWSKSLDLGSDGERIASANSRGYSQILNSFNPKLNKGPSDFDVRHNISVNAIAKLPFGRGAKYLANSGALMDSVVGGWTVTGLSHWTSGLPFNAFDGKGWTTNFDLRSYMVRTGPIASGGHHLDKGGNPNAFSDPAAALKNMRLPYPGEAGERNVFRGDGYFSTDVGLHKEFHVYKEKSLQVAGEAFNVFNSVRFDPKSVSNNANTASSFGRYTTLLTQSRRLQLSARFSF